MKGLLLAALLLVLAAPALAAPDLRIYRPPRDVQAAPQITLLTVIENLTTRVNRMVCGLPSARLYSGLTGGELCFREGTLHLCINARQDGPRSMAYGITFSDTPDPCTRFDPP